MRSFGGTDDSLDRRWAFLFRSERAAESESREIENLFGDADDMDINDIEVRGETVVVEVTIYY